MKILLVEDDANTEQLVHFALSEVNMDHKLITVHDGDEAIEIILSRHKTISLAEIKLVILDLKLPKVNGTEVLNIIRNNPATLHLPAIMFTSSEDPKDIEKCYQLGANSYALKPTDFAEFTDCIQTIGKYWLMFNQVLPE